MMKELILSLFLFISAETSYNTDLPIPNIVFLPEADLVKMYVGDENKEHNPDDLWAFYSLENKSIYLRDTWDQYNAWNKSILLHELIHYVQDMNGAKFSCIQEMEKESWPLQQKYLRQYHGVNWDYDQLWFLMISTCPAHLQNY
tara:strand:+ start:2556 stop:2987 length:432 start_codon:yes stop_codon:yes gene_type:complete